MKKFYNYIKLRKNWKLNVWNILEFNINNQLFSISFKYFIYFKTIYGLDWWDINYQMKQMNLNKYSKAELISRFKN